MIGRTLAHYEILEKIGQGGMGEVFLARDTKLDRNVALKILPPELAESDERRTRFEREAKALAALNHPGIVTIHSVEQAESVHFITMELVEGQTLAEHIPKKGMNAEAFFDFAIPLVDALAAAHEQGIVHRDLKPANVMVTRDGRVKVLDFGLARPGPLAVAAVESESPTELKTQDGVLAGTLHYMSPEQAEGKAVDHRSDIFSLGVVFHQALTGAVPFQGDSPAAVLGAIVRDEPRLLSESAPNVPYALAKIVRRALKKDLSDRYQSALDLRNDLKELREELAAGVVPPVHRPTTSQPGRWVAVVAFVMGTVAVGFWLATERDDAAPRLTNPVQVTRDTGVEDYPSLSPDGSSVAYESDRAGNLDIWIAPADGSGGALNRTADHTGADRHPTWSPDGSQIAFFSSRDGGGIYVMPVLAGAPRRVAMTVGQGDELSNPPVWSRDGREIATWGTDESDVQRFLQVTAVDTGETKRYPIPGGQVQDLTGSPNGRFLAWLRGNHSYEVSAIWALDTHSGEAYAVTDGLWRDQSPVWSPDGRTLFFVSNRLGGMDLWTLRLDESGRPLGQPTSVVSGVGIRHASLSADGSAVAYSKGRVVANVWRVPILADRPATWDDAEQITFDEAFVEHVDVSRDGESLVVASDRSGNADLWMLPAAGGVMRQLTTSSLPEAAGRWSPDGEHVAFEGYQREGRWSISVVPSGGGQVREVAARGDYPGWSPDGDEVSYRFQRSFWAVPVDGGTARRLSSHEFTIRPQVGGDWSPDGAWMAFENGVFPTYRVWVSEVPDGEPQSLSTSDASVNRWMPDSESVVFVEWDHETNGGRGVNSVSIRDRKERRLTELVGRRGTLGSEALATDGEYVYFTWEERSGDIWTMDVVQE